jgi:hypothetical protein
MVLKRVFLAGCLHHKLHELYKRVDLLSDEDQKALIVLLDSLIARANMQRLMGESQTIRG